MFVCSYTQTTFLTQAESENINAQHDGVALPREKEETQKRAATKTGEGDSAPHKHAVAARPSTRPAGAASTRALQAETPPTRMSYLKANPQQAATHQNNTRREGFAQRLTKDPVQHDLVDPSTSYK